MGETTGKETVLGGEKRLKRRNLTAWEKRVSRCVCVCVCVCVCGWGTSCFPYRNERNTGEGPDPEGVYALFPQPELK